MNAWGTAGWPVRRAAPVVFRHERCGHEGHAEVVCSSCGEAMTAEDTRPRLGPGYPSRLAERPEVRGRFAG